jgi:hypothetical protein
LLDTSGKPLKTFASPEIRKRQGTQEKTAEPLRFLAARVAGDSPSIPVPLSRPFMCLLYLSL